MLDRYLIRLGPLYGTRIPTYTCSPATCTLIAPVDTSIDSEYPIFYADLSYRGEKDSHIIFLRSSSSKANNEISYFYSHKLSVQFNK